VWSAFAVSSLAYALETPMFVARAILVRFGLSHPQFERGTVRRCPGIKYRVLNYLCVLQHALRQMARTSPHCKRTSQVRPFLHSASYRSAPHKYCSKRTSRIPKYSENFQATPAWIRCRSTPHHDSTLTLLSYEQSTYGVDRRSSIVSSNVPSVSKQSFSLCDEARQSTAGAQRRGRCKAQLVRHSNKRCDCFWWDDRKAA